VYRRQGTTESCVADSQMHVVRPVIVETFGDA
jgi:hypothetical protein